MSNRLSVRLALLYGMIILAGFIMVDGLLIYKYQQNRFYRSEASYKSLSDMIGTVLGEMDVTDDIKLNTTVLKQGRIISGRLLVINDAGMVLADSLNEYEYTSVTNREIRDALLQKRPSSGYYNYKGRRIMQLAVPASDLFDNRLVIFISSDVQNIQNEVNAFRNQVIGITLFVGCIVFVFTIFTGRYLTNPILKLTMASRSIMKGRFNTTVDIERNDEIGELAAAFNSMSSELYKFDNNRRRFISDVSHELKTPLASIKALIESLLEGRNDINTYNEYLSDVNTEIDRLTELVRSLLSATRLDEVSLRRERFDMCSEIEDIVKFYTPLAAKKDITISNKCIEPCIISADRDRFREILLNLIDNGIKYGNSGGNISISHMELEDEVILEIGDDGIGVSREALPYIFDSFYRVDGARSRETGGYGIGLYIVKRITDLHDWTIRVESTPGRGTVFTLIIGKSLDFV